MNDIENNKNEFEVCYLRREMDRTYSERLLRLEQNTEELERLVRKELTDIHVSLKQIIDCQNEHEPAMKSMEHVMGAGLIMRWIVIVIVGGLAAIGTTATAIEAVRSWLK